MNITYKTIVSTAVLFLLFTSSVSMADAMDKPAMDKPAMDMPAMDDSMAMMMKLEPFFYKPQNGSHTGTNGLAILLNYTFTHKDLGKLG
jgi:hypothetical protein